jgi:hypothetical protein
LPIFGCFKEVMKIFTHIVIGVLVLFSLAIYTHAQEISSADAGALTRYDKAGRDPDDVKGGDGPENLITASTYAFSVQSGIGLEDMSSGTTQLIGPGTEDDNSQLGQIGFLYRFDGGFYTTFGVNGNGFARLGAVTTFASFSNSISSTENSPKIMPYWDNLCVGSSGKVHYKTVGSPGSLKLVVEWANMKITRGGGCGGSGSGTFQMWLYERTGVVQFVYGNGMVAPSAADGGYSVGIQSGAATNFASITASNGTVSYTTANNTQAAAINAGTSFILTPNMPLAPTNGNANPVGKTSVTLNWTDNANDETGYLVRRTTDNVNFYFIGYPGPNATTFNESGLTPGMQYLYYVNALSDGAFSPDLVIPVTTNPAGAVSATATGGLWSSPSTWSGGAVPTEGDNVTISSGSTVIIDTAAVALSVTVGSVGSLAEQEKGAAPEGGAPGVLRFGETGAFSLTVTNDVTIGANDAFTTGGGNANQHVLTVGGNLTNNGTLDFSTNNNSASAGIVFTGNSSNTFGGTGPVTDIRSITISKGPSNANVLELSVANFTVVGSATDTPDSGYLYLGEGTFKISGTFSGNHRTFANPGYQINPAAGIWLNNPNYTITAQDSPSVRVFGLLRMSAGTYNVGSLVDQSLQFNQGSNVIIEGGSINTSGKFEKQSNGQFPFRYNQTGGTVTVCTVPNFSAFCGGYSIAGVVSMSDNVSLTGGTIVVQNAGGFLFGGTGGITLDNYDVTVRFGNSQTAQAGIFGAAGHLPNLILDTTAGGHTLAVGSSAIMKVRSVIIGSGGTLDLTSSMLQLTGESFVNNGHITSTQNTSGLAFAGPNAVYSGSGTAFVHTVQMLGTTFTLDSINNLRVRRIFFDSGDIVHANKLTLGNNDSTVNRIFIGRLVEVPVGQFDAAPVFDLGLGGQEVYYQNTDPARTTGPEINPSRALIAFGFSGASFSDTLTIAGGDLTVNNLYMTRGVIATGPNKIIHLEGGDNFPQGYIDGTLVRKFFGAGSYTFRVGDGGRMTPIMANVSAVGAGGAYLSVTAVDATLPGLLPATSVSRYWKLEEIGDLTATVAFIYPGDEARGDENNYKLWRSTGGPPVVVPGSSVDGSSDRALTPQGTTEFTGDWGIGEQLDPGPVSISGTVMTSGGQPIRNALLTLTGGNLPAPLTVQTGNFGTYSFTNLQAGETYTVRVDVKRYRFTPATQMVTPLGNVANVNFVANPGE